MSIKLIEQKFTAPVAILKWLIHTAYDHRLLPRAVYYTALVKIITHVNKVAISSELFSFVNEPSDLFLDKT